MSTTALRESRIRSGSVAAVTGALVLVVIALAAGWQMAIWPLNQKSSKALERRAQYFWDLKVSGDSLGAYSYMAEIYRRRVTPVGFKNEGGGAVVHTGAKVKGVRLDEKGGLVDIELKHIYNKPHYEDLEVTTQSTERWIFENGAWYRWPPGFMSSTESLPAQ